MAAYALYGSPASYFTGKARGYMRWKGIEYEEFPVGAEVMKDIILAHVGWPVIPVVKTPDGRIVQDTVDIISDIETTFPDKPVMPEGPVQRFVSQLLQLYGDEWLTLPAMHYRWHYNEEWIYSEFGKSMAPDAPPEAQYTLGKERGQMFKGFVPILGINEETIPGVEAAYEAFLADFSAHLEVHPYLFGGRPSFADFAFLGPLYAHLYRDPASGELMKRLAPRVANWTERTTAGETGTGELIGDDAIPETLIPILVRHMAEHLPVLEAANVMFTHWLKTAAPGEELPRGFGLANFTTGGRTGQCMARSFSLFRLQAALDAYATLEGAAKTQADALLDKIGGTALKTFTLPHRLERRDYRLKLAL